MMCRTGTALLVTFLLFCITANAYGQRRNRPPEVVASFSHITLSPLDSLFSKDLQREPVFFVDRNGDSLRYTVSTNAPQILRIELFENRFLNVALLEARLPGRAVVTLFADDGRGGAAQFSFFVNRPPVQSSALRDTVLTIGAPALQMALASHFADPDGDPLQYRVAVAPRSVATAALSGPELSIALNRPAVGSIATITVAALDTFGAEIEKSFQVRANFPPYRLHPLPAQTLNSAKPFFTKDLNADPLAFLDPDGDSLRYRVASSDTTIVKAEIPGGTSLLFAYLQNARAPGRAALVVAADDGRGGVTTAPLRINRAPYLHQRIGAQTLTIGSAPFTRDLDSPPAVFSDPDGDLLQYTAISSDTSIAKAGTAGSRLTVFLNTAAVGSGSSDIRVVATDSLGAFAAEVFPVKANHAPDAALADSIESMTLTLGGPNFALDLIELFHDADTDVLAFTASSSDTAVALAAISRNTLIITPAGHGRAQINILANDGLGGTSNVQISVYVNRPPRLQNRLPDRVLTVGGPNLRLPLGAAPVFADPDEEDELTFATVSKDSAIAVPYLVGDTLVVRLSTPETGDSTLIFITAEDNYGASATDSFSVAVNMPPAGRSQPDRVAKLSDRFMRISLDTVFVDPDGDPLHYVIRSDSTRVAESSLLSGQLLQIAFIAPGETTIRLRASDGRGGRDSLSFALTVSRSTPPQLRTITLPSLLPIDSPIPITARIGNDDGVPGVRLHFRAGGETLFASIAMQARGTANDSLYEFAAVLPAAASTSRGIEYYLELRDFDNHVRVPATGTFSPPLAIPAPGLEHTLQVSGNTIGEYRLVSFPLQLADPAPAALLEDDLGADRQGTRWRFLELLANHAELLSRNAGARVYADYFEFSAVQAGTAYWLLTKEPAVALDTGAGATLPLNVPYAIDIPPAGGFIGNPFAFPAFLADTLSSGQPASLMSYAGSWSEVRQGSAHALQPFAGYWLENKSAETVQAYVLPHPASSGTHPRAKAAPRQDRWAIRILATTRSAQDGNNFAGVAPGSLPGADAKDHFEPPPVGDFVSAYFPHPDWSEIMHRYTTDIRAPSSNGLEWRLEIVCRQPASVALRFQNLQQVPAHLEIWLQDPLLNLAYNLRERPVVNIASRGMRPRPLTLVVGPAEFVQKYRELRAGRPSNFELAQNFPNPFNPSTTIKFGLPAATPVRLTVYNLLGEEVARLIDGDELPAGYHAAIWDGRQQNGRPAPSGVYVYALRAGAFSAVKKMLLVK